MKILFINLPYYGHVVPTIGLVQELVKRDCQVTYLIASGWEEMLEASGAQIEVYDNHQKLSEQIRNAYVTAEKMIKEYDLVIYEQFFFLGKHLAEKYQKPVVRVFTAPATNKQLMNEYINAGGALGIFRYRWIGKQWTKQVAKGIELKTECWLDEIVENPPELNLVYTLEEYQPYVDAFPKEQYKFLGASVYDRKYPEFELNETEGPLIYISLGTVVKGAVSFYKKCIQAFKDENVTVILSVGKKFQIEKLGTIPANFYVRNFVPQLQVLEKASVFVTHGGMNSISEALVQGVPMVVIPFMADQPTNAGRVEALGLGRKLDYDKISSENIRTVTLAVMEDRVIKENVSEMKHKMARCLGNQGGADAILGYYRRKVEERYETKQIII